MKTLSKQDIEDLINGATILGTGGGGSPEQGLKLLMEQYNLGRKLNVASVSEFKSEGIIASPYSVGSMASAAMKITDKKKIEDPMSTAVALLEKNLSQTIIGTVATELGGGNTAASLAIAAKLGVPTVDGDLMGRAGPELHQSTLHIFSFPMVPSAIVSDSGNEFVVLSYSGIDDYEALARYASVISGGHVSVVDSPLTMAQAKQCVVQGSVSLCTEIGKARREAIAKGRDPIQDVVSKLSNGRKIFEGSISKYIWKNEKGFLYGEAFVSGSDSFKGKTLKSWIMNEHIMCWIDDKPAIMSPDPIMFLDPVTGMGITNDKLKEGMNVAVLGSSIDKMWRSESGLRLFGPKHFNFDVDYVPFEKMH